MLAKSEPPPGKPLKTTIDPDLQEAAVAGARRAGRAASRCSTPATAPSGRWPAAPSPPRSRPARPSRSSPRPRRCRRARSKLDDQFPVTDGINVGGRFIANAHDEFCGGSFAESFAALLQRGLRAARPRRSARSDLVDDRRALRLQLRADPLQRGGDRGSPTRPSRRSRRTSATTSTSGSPRSARARCWRPRWRWPRSPRPSPAAGCACPTPIVSKTRRCRPTPSRSG